MSPPLSRTDAKAAGLKRYFTGEPCPHGHVAERRVSDFGCVECSRLKSRNSNERERRRDYMAEHQRNYRRDHPDRVKATESKRDKKRAAELRRQAREKNPERDRAASRRSFQKHKAKRMAEAKAWREDNPEVHRLLQRAAKARRRALELGAEGAYTRQDIERLFIEQDGKCAGCWCDLKGEFHVDHKHPLSRGGSNWPINLQLMCRPCNQSKCDKTMEEWIAWKWQMIRFVQANEFIVFVIVHGRV